MSLLRLSAFDVATYKDAVAAANGYTANAYIVSGQADPTFGGDTLWMQARDRYYMVGTTGGSLQYISSFWDPALLDAAPPATKIAASSVTDSGRTFLPGQYDAQALTQKLYTAFGSGGNLIPREMNIDTLVISAGAAFTGPNGDFNMFQSVSLDFAGTEGTWQSFKTGVWIFEGLTDGIPGETVSTGANVYPDGLFLTQCNDGRVNGTQFQNGWAWVDIRNRNAVGRLGGIPPTSFPARAEANPNSLEDQTEAPISEEEFDWQVHGYQADADSIFVQPKGELFFVSEFIPLVTAGLPTPGDFALCYVRWADFNPYNLASAVGTPNRIHGRITQTSRVTIEVAPMFGIVGANDVSALQGDRPSPIYDPIRRRVVLFLHDHIPIAEQELPGRNALSFWSRQPDPVIVTAPTAVGVPRTADIVDYNTFVGGDLAEPAPALDVDWTLSAASTELEVLPITGGIGSTSTVVSAPIDDTVPTTPGGTLAILADGVPLVVTTDYTVVLSTGVVTWVTDQQGAAVVQASYEHRGVPIQPPHGTLLTSVTRTDADGNARTQVQYADDDALVGRLDIITSELA